MIRLLDDQITVVEVGDSISASVCGRFLSDFGATVIKVEPVGGSLSRLTPPLANNGGQTFSTLFTYLNRGKTVFKGDDDGNPVAQLIQDRADVVLLSGSRQGALSASRSSAESLRELKDTLIVGRVSVFGDVEPYCDTLGGELQVLALGGLLHMIGEQDREPIRLGGYQAQYAAGLSLLTGVALALFQREQSGLGSEIVTSVFETVAYIEWKGAVHYQNDGTVLTRGSRTGPLVLPCNDGFSAFYYRSSDWSAVKELFNDVQLDRPEFATQELRDQDQNRQALFCALAEVTRRQSKMDLYHKAQSLGIPVGYMATISDLLESKQYESRQFFDEIDLKEFGRGVVPSGPWKLQRIESDLTAQS